MKKMLIVLVVALASSSSSAFDDFQASSNKCEHSRKNSFLDADTLSDGYAFKDEYTHEEGVMEAIDEYDQNVTDSVKPSKVSMAEAMLKEIMGAVLVRYIVMREMVGIYYKEFKNILTQWYHTIIK